MTLPDLIAHLGSEQEVLAFHAWREGNEWADTWADDGDGVAECLAEWFLRGLPALTLAEVVQWLADWNNPDAIGGTDQELLDLIKEYKQ